MSGHSKWAQIRRQKAVTDKKKGQVFSKLSREITIAAKSGGNPDMNFKLRLVLDRARAAGMTKDIIERAIKRGTGEETAGQLETVIYEGYGPHGTAFLVEAATDNKNRTASNLKHLFEKHHGHLGAPGSVAWQFVTRGQILVERDSADLGKFSLLAIDAGAEDVRESTEGLEVYTLPVDLDKVKQALLQAGAKLAQAEIIQESTQGVNLDLAQKPEVDALFADLENDEDVLAVHTSANL